MTTLTLSARQFDTLVAPVIPHAATGLPVLEAVLVRTSGQYVTALATDRYKIGFHRIQLDEAPPAGFRALLPLQVLAQIRRLFRVTRGHDPVLSLDIDGDTLRVTAADVLSGASFGGLTGASLTFSLDRLGEFPRIDHLVRDALTAEPGPDAVPMNVNPTFLASFKTGQPPRVGMQITSTGGEHKPWLIRVGDDFVGLIVPIRFGANDAPGDADTWLPLLDADKREEKAA